MLGQPASPIIQKAEQAILSKVPAQLKDAFQRVLSAGMTILYAPALKAQLQQKLATTDPVQTASQGSVNLIAELYKQSKFTIPAPLVVPAVVMFALEYLDLAQKAGKIQVTAQVVGQVTQLATSKLIALTKQQGGQTAAQPNAQVAPTQAPQPAQSAGIIGGAVQGGA